MTGCYAVCHKQLGDVLLLEPTLRWLASQYGGKVRLLTRSGHRPLIDLMESVSFAGGLSLFPKSLLVAFDSRRKTLFRSAITPAHEKWFVRRTPDEKPPNTARIFAKTLGSDLGNQYVGQYFLDAIATKKVKAEPRLDSPPNSWRVPGITNDYILVNPTAGWKSKNWKPESWAELLRMLPDDQPYRYLLTSGGQEWQIAMARKIANATPSAEVVESTSLEQFLWICANARAVLTVDGAASHLARAFQVPALTLFGSTSKQNWHLDSPEHIAIESDGKSMANSSSNPLSNLTPSQVLPVAKALLDRALRTNQ